MQGHQCQQSIEGAIVFAKTAIKIGFELEAKMCVCFQQQILKFNDIHLLQLGQFMYSYKSSSLPLKFSNKFLQNSQFHNYNTRNSHALHLPYCGTNVKKFSVFFQGPKFYNSLDSEILNTNSIYSFKKTLKNKIVNNYE